MTSGNPLLLRQLLRALADEGVRPDVSHVDTVRAVGSRAVSALVTLRLRRMPPTVTAAARAVAVLGEAADLPTVAALAREPEAEVATALDVLSRSEILTRDERHLCFVHPLVRDAVYDDLPAGERALHHERAAEVLLAQGATPEQVAGHVLRAPRRGSAATVALLRAAAADGDLAGRVGGSGGAAQARARGAGIRTRAHRPAGRARTRRDPRRRALGRGPSRRRVRRPRRAARAGPAGDGHRPHPRLRLPARRRDVVRALGGRHAARRPRRRAAGPARAAADDGLHARPARRRLPRRPAAAGLRRGRRGAHAGRDAVATSCCARARTARAPSGWPASRSRATGCSRSTTACCGSSPPTCCCSRTTSSATSGTGR